MGRRRPPARGGPGHPVPQAQGPQRPARQRSCGILVALLIVIYLLQNPVAQNVDIPAVDYNPAGKQAAYKLTEIWLKDNPLGKNAVITSWDGCKETTYKDGDRTIPVYRHDLTVESSLGWWTVRTTIRTDSNGLLGYPSATRKSLPNTATPNGNITWPGTLSDATASDALTRLLTQWGQAYVGHDADMLTTIVKDPDTRIKYKPLRCPTRRRPPSTRAATSTAATWIRTRTRPTAPSSASTSNCPRTRPRHRPTPTSNPARTRTPTAPTAAPRTARRSPTTWSWPIRTLAIHLAWGAARRPDRI